MDENLIFAEEQFRRSMVLIHSNNEREIVLNIVLYCTALCSHSSSPWRVISGFLNFDVIF